jgi:1,4-dihydroxy-2-naphthoate octaprenyltransferase
MQKALALVRMGRPNILPGGILAYSLGAAMGYGQHGVFDWGLFGLGLLITELTNLVAHYADEYGDVDTDSLTRRTVFSGGSGVLPAGNPVAGLGHMPSTMMIVATPMRPKRMVT